MNKEILKQRVLTATLILLLFLSSIGNMSAIHAIHEVDALNQQLIAQQIQIEDIREEEREIFDTSELEEDIEMVAFALCINQHVLTTLLDGEVPRGFGDCLDEWERWYEKYKKNKRKDERDL